MADSWKSRCLVILLAVACSSCQDVSTDPEVEIGRRDYVWSFDTLKYAGSFQIDMAAIWGSSSRDVYVCGHNDHWGPGTVFHYDGFLWSASRFHRSLGGPIKGSVSFHDVYGFGKDDVYIVGERLFYNPNPTSTIIDSAVVIHYDGVSWKDISPKGPPLYGIHGTSSSNIWTVGSTGSSFHYNGSTWTYSQLDSGLLLSSVACLPNGRAFAVGYISDKALPIDSSGFYLNRFTDSRWVRIDSIIDYEWGFLQRFGPRLRAYGGQLFSVGPAYYRYDDPNWTQVFARSRIYHVTKTSERNVFLVGESVYHFNGTDWKEIEGLRITPGFSRTGCYTDGEQVFILESNGLLSRVLHGWLKTN